MRGSATPKGNTTEERKAKRRRKQEKKISKVSFQHSRAIGEKQIKDQRMRRKAISRPQRLLSIRKA